MHFLLVQVHMISDVCDYLNHFSWYLWKKVMLQAQTVDWMKLYVI